VFLFEKVIIMSKKFEAPSQKKAQKADNYLYKAHLPVRTIKYWRESLSYFALKYKLGKL